MRVFYLTKHHRSATDLAGEDARRVRDGLCWVVLLCVENNWYPNKFLRTIYLFVPERRGTKIIPLILNDQTYNIAVLDHNKDECLVDIDHSRGQKPSEET